MRSLSVSPAVALNEGADEILVQVVCHGEFLRNLTGLPLEKVGKPPPCEREHC